MADKKLLDEDRDEWFYHSLKKYSNLYMFELEFPLDTLEIINETSLCVSGVQAYSKSCELLQLCVPPKLLHSEDDEGLCKDRDFKILSGGYASGRIRRVKFIKSSTNLVATLQDGYTGVVIYEVGDDNRATIQEKYKLPTIDGTSGKRQSLCSMNEKLILGADPMSSETLACNQRRGTIISEWKVDDTCPILAKTHYLWNSVGYFDPGSIVKIKEWSPDTCIFLTSRGTMAIYDFRSGANVPEVFFHTTKSPNNIANDPSVSSSSTTPIIFSFDCIPKRNHVGVIDSCGGYETYDPRFIGKGEMKSEDVGGTKAAVDGDGTTETSTQSRCLLSQEFSNVSGVYSDHFNIEYEESTKMRETERNRFIISGLKTEYVPVLSENTADTLSIHPVFSHDGHSKHVTHATWHPVAENLIFSSSIDAVLHAWQYIPDSSDK